MNNGIWFVLIKEIYICSKQIKTIYSYSNLLHVSFYDFMYTIIKFFLYICVQREFFFVHIQSRLLIHFYCLLYVHYLSNVCLCNWVLYILWIASSCYNHFKIKIQEAYTTHTPVKIKKTQLHKALNKYHNIELEEWKISLFPLWEMNGSYLQNLSLSHPRMLCA